MNGLRRNLLLVTHDYHWLIPGFVHFWGKYLAEPVLVVSDRQPANLPAEFSYLRVPCYAEGDWPWAHWFGNGLRSVLEVITEPVITLWLPDMWLAQRVDAEGVDRLTLYAAQHPALVRLNLGEVIGVRDTATFYQAWGGYEIYGPGKNNRALGYYGGLRFGQALWCRQRLLSIVEPGWDLWGFEQAGTHRMWDKFPDYESLIVLPCPVRAANVLTRGRSQLNLSGLDEADREEAQRWNL